MHLTLPAQISHVVTTAAAYNQGIEALEQAILETVQAGKVQAADLDLASTASSGVVTS